jgi:hypothetical protein
MGTDDYLQLLHIQWIRRVTMEMSDERQTVATVCESRQISTSQYVRIILSGVSIGAIGTKVVGNPMRDTVANFVSDKSRRSAVGRAP